MKAWEEQQACWESQRNELEQRAEDEAEKVDKIEKYGPIARVVNKSPFLSVRAFSQAEIDELEFF